MTAYNRAPPEFHIDNYREGWKPFVCNDEGGCLFWGHPFVNGKKAKEKIDACHVNHRCRAYPGKKKITRKLGIKSHKCQLDHSGYPCIQRLPREMEDDFIRRAESQRMSTGKVKGKAKQKKQINGMQDQTAYYQKIKTMGREDLNEEKEHYEMNDREIIRETRKTTLDKGSSSTSGKNKNRTELDTQLIKSLLELKAEELKKALLWVKDHANDEEKRKKLSPAEKQQFQIISHFYRMQQQKKRQAEYANYPSGKRRRLDTKPSSSQPEMDNFQSWGSKISAQSNLAPENDYYNPFQTPKESRSQSFLRSIGSNEKDHIMQGSVKGIAKKQGKNRIVDDLFESKLHSPVSLGSNLYSPFKTLLSEPSGKEGRTEEINTALQDAKMYFGKKWYNRAIVEYAFILRNIETKDTLRYNTLSAIVHCYVYREVSPNPELYDEEDGLGKLESGERSFKQVEQIYEKLKRTMGNEVGNVPDAQNSILRNILKAYRVLRKHLEKLRAEAGQM